MKNKKISHVYIIILNWNGWKDTLACLESVLDLDYPYFHIVICDNNSTDDSFKRILDWVSEYHITKDLVSPENGRNYFGNEPIQTEHLVYVRESQKFQTIIGVDDEGFSRHPASRITIINTGGNWGYAGGNNVGIRFALKRIDCDYVWVLNNDTVVDPNSLGYLVDKLSGNRAYGVCGSTLISYEEDNLVQTQGGCTYNKWTGLAKNISCSKGRNDLLGEDKVENMMSYVSGAAMLVSKGFLDDIGLLSEDYFLYFEEIDWATRSKGKYKLAYCSRSIVYHKEGATIGSNSDTRKASLLSEFYLFRSKVKFTKKFFKYAMPSVYLFSALQAFNRIIRSDYKKAYSIFKILITFGNCKYVKK